MQRGGPDRHEPKIVNICVEHGAEHLLRTRPNFFCGDLHDDFLPDFIHRAAWTPFKINCLLRFPVIFIDSTELMMVNYEPLCKTLLSLLLSALKKTDYVVFQKSHARFPSSIQNSFRRSFWAAVFVCNGLGGDEGNILTFIHDLFTPIIPFKIGLSIRFRSVGRLNNTALVHNVSHDYWRAIDDAAVFKSLVRRFLPCGCAPHFRSGLQKLCRRRFFQS